MENDTLTQVTQQTKKLGEIYAVGQAGTCWDNPTYVGRKLAMIIHQLLGGMNAHKNGTSINLQMRSQHFSPKQLLASNTITAQKIHGRGPSMHRPSPTDVEQILQRRTQQIHHHDVEVTCEQKSHEITFHPQTVAIADELAGQEAPAL